MKITPVASPQSFESIITKRLRLAIMCSFRCYEDLPTCGEGGATFQKYLIDRYPYPLIVFQKKLTREEVVAILNQEFGGKEM